jgi:hypothetical protein
MLFPILQSSCLILNPDVARAAVDLDPNVVKDATSLEEIQLLDYLDEGIAWGK